MPAFGNKHQRKGLKGQNRNPLRRVVSVKSTTRGEFYRERGDVGDVLLPMYAITVEVLECGHERRVKSDHVGPTNAQRRRCAQCGQAAEACVVRPGDMEVALGIGVVRSGYRILIRRIPWEGLWRVTVESLDGESECSTWYESQTDALEWGFGYVRNILSRRGRS
jgi:hypothetical protein